MKKTLFIACIAVLGNITYETSALDACLWNSNQTSQAQIAPLQAENTQLRQELAQVRSESTGLQHEIQQKDEEITLLTAERNSLQEANDRLEGEKGEAIQEKQVAIEEVNELRPGASIFGMLKDPTTIPANFLQGKHNITGDNFGSNLKKVFNPSFNPGVFGILNDLSGNLASDAITTVGFNGDLGKLAYLYQKNKITEGASEALALRFLKSMIASINDEDVGLLDPVDGVAADIFAKGLICAFARDIILYSDDGYNFDPATTISSAEDETQM